MNLVEQLALAEKLANDHNRWHEFSSIYIKKRNLNKVKLSIELTLREMGLWKEYCEKLSTAI